MEEREEVVELEGATELGAALELSGALGNVVTWGRWLRVKHTEGAEHQVVTRLQVVRLDERNISEASTEETRGGRVWRVVDVVNDVLEVDAWDRLLKLVLVGIQVQEGQWVAQVSEGERQKCARGAVLVAKVRVRESEGLISNATED